MTAQRILNTNSIAEILTFIFIVSIPDVQNVDKSSAVGEMGDRGHNRHGPKIRGLCPFLGEGSRVPI